MGGSFFRDYLPRESFFLDLNENKKVLWIFKLKIRLKWSFRVFSRGIINGNVNVTIGWFFFLFLEIHLLKVLFSQIGMETRRFCRSFDWKSSWWGKKKQLSCNLEWMPSRKSGETRIDYEMRPVSKVENPKFVRRIH